MRSRYRINDPSQPYFITATVVNWLPVFTNAACCNIIVRALSFCPRARRE
jgi:putative transposase